MNNQSNNDIFWVCANCDSTYPGKPDWLCEEAGYTQSFCNDCFEIQELDKTYKKYWRPE